MTEFAPYEALLAHRFALLASSDDGDWLDVRHRARKTQQRRAAVLAAAVVAAIAVAAPALGVHRVIVNWFQAGPASERTQLATPAPEWTDPDVILASLAGPFSLDASRPPFVCPRLRPSVELAFGMWGGPGTSLQREQFALVGSWGADRYGGYAIFGAATPTKAYRDPACARSSSPPDAGSDGLAQVYRFRKAGNNAYFVGADGDRLIGELLHPRTVSALHVREPSAVGFTCVTTGRVIVRLKDVKEGARSVGTELRVFDSRKLLGVAVVRKSGASYFRVASSCAQR
jgi:hypothetical protein